MAPISQRACRKGELRNMNSLVGKSTGIALLMAAALIAALFAMGVFSATGVSAHDPAPGATDGGHLATSADLEELIHDLLPDAADVANAISVHYDQPRASAANSLDVTDGTKNLAFGDDDNDNTADLYNEHDHRYSVSLNAAIADEREILQVRVVTGADGTADHVQAYRGERYLDGMATATLPERQVLDVEAFGGTDYDVVLFNINLADFANVANSALWIIVNDEVNTLPLPANGGPGSYRIDLKYTNPLSSDTPGAAVQVTLNTTNTAAIAGGHDIVVDFGKNGFGIPSSIPEERILIEDTLVAAVSGDIDTGYKGNPGSVTVSGSKVTLTMPFTLPNGSTASPPIATGTYKVTFKQSAGITNPTSRGVKTIKVADNDSTADSIRGVVKSKVTLDPAVGKRGTAVTVTGKGFGRGDATVYLVSYKTDPLSDDFDGFRLGKGTVSDGTVTVNIDATTLNFVRGAVPNDKKDAFLGLNTLRIVDGTGKAGDLRAQFEITPLIELDVDVVKRGGKLLINIEDWAYRHIAQITIGDIPVTHKFERGNEVDFGTENVDDGEAEFTIVVPTDVRLGEQEMVIKGPPQLETHAGQQGKPFDGKRDVAKTTIVVGAFDLTLTPSTAVIHQVIRIEGSGFDKSSGACITEITVGDELILQSTSGNKVSDLIEGSRAGVPTFSCVSDSVEADSNGNLADSFKVPQNLRAGTHRVTVKDSSSRVGVADLTIPEPEIELDPPSSQRGSVVTVVGRNFPAEDLVTVAYEDEANTVTATTTDTVGNFRSTFQVPVDAVIGEKHEVLAKSEKKARAPDFPQLKAKMEHEIPDEILNVSPDVVAPGTRLTVTASNLPLYTPVSVTIGGIGVAGRVVGDEVASDGTGSWEDSLLVPQLTPGTHTVELTVHGTGSVVNVAAFVEIADIVTRSSDEAFADLIENVTLTRVWYLDRATQTWSFYDPAPEFAEFNTLAEVSTGQIVTIIMNAQDTFQGGTLYVGSNPVSIE